MAISFVGSGGPVSGDTNVTGLSITCPYPAGKAAGDLLLLFVGLDDNFGPQQTPANWNLLYAGGAATSKVTPYYAPPHAYVYWKISDANDLALAGVVANFQAWPNGYPYYTMAVLAYRGCDPVSPIERWFASTTVSTAAALAHPAVTTTVNADWLITARWASVNFTSAATVTVTGGTNSERIDVSDHEPELTMALYDSNGALSTGAQTVRTTTTSVISNFGSIGLSIAIRPPDSAVVTASAGQAASIGVAYNAMAIIKDGPWQLCDSMPVYSFGIDWDGDGDFTDPGENVTPDVLDGGVSISYGRDQSRQYTPAKTGTSSFSLNNSERTYSPENSSGPLFGDLDPAKNMQGGVVFGGTSYALGRMRVDDFNITADFGNRTLDLSFLDGMKSLDGIKMSTGVLRSQRTGDLINFILDQVGWTGGRSIDPGATIVGWWWLEGTTALQAVQDLVKSEGPPSIAYVALDGTFIFRDRHHRILRSASLVPQASYTQGELGECSSPAATGLSFTAPFEYAHGWRDIVNSVSFDAVVRSVGGDLVQVWTSGTSISLTTGQSVTVTASAQDPFVNAQVPVSGTDYTLTGVGTVNAMISRSDGASVDITLLAVGGNVVISDLQLRAQSIGVVSTVTVTRKDTDSITSHGEQAYPETAPWAGPQDAYAVAGLILLHYAKRRPTVQLRLTASDPRHLFEILNRAISDRVRITFGEMGLDNDFFIETITHSISRMNSTQPPVHAVVFGCEKETEISSNPFRFDTRGSGFDQGVFDPLGSDDPSQVFVWDDPRGSFDFGVFGT